MNIDWMFDASHPSYSSHCQKSSRLATFSSAWGYMLLLFAMVKTDEISDIGQIGLFSYHPPLQTLAIILFVQGVLTLQPTVTKSDKARGLAFHQIFQIAGLGIGMCCHVIT